jgi:rSAM/selenodomain-associated transferase 2
MVDNQYARAILQECGDLSKKSIRVSVVIPTLNEAARIGRLVAHLHRSADHRLADILVVDGHSDDATAEKARAAGARVLVCPNRSRAAQMNLGAREATGDVLYFVHADALPPATYLDAIEHALGEGYPIGCFRLEFDADHPLLRINAFCTRFDLPFFRGGDQTLFVTRTLFEQTGGYDERHVLMEEYDWLRRVRRLGRFYIVPQTVVVSARKYETISYLRVNLANAIVYGLYAIGVSPGRLRRLYCRLLGRA